MGNVLIWGIRTYICLLLLHRGSGLTYSADKKFVTVLQSVKAWRGSCVLLPCTHSYPEVISNYTWYHNPVYDKQKKEFNGEKVYNSLSNTGIDSLFENNVEYRGTKEKDCTILIKNLTNEHSGQYGLRLFHSSSDFKWMSKTYVNVTVSDAGPGIEIEPVPEIKEFQLVTLTCSIKYHCPLHNISLSWMEDINGTAKTEIRYDTRDISTKTSLTFRPSWADHNKNFTCFLHQWDQEKNESQSVQLKVTYAPKNVKIWSNNTTTFVEGDSITLECSVEASNPPVHSYTWYKNANDLHLSANTITVTEAGKYNCEAGNAVAEIQSKVVEISMLYAPKKPLIKTEGPIVEGRTVTLSCATSANPPVFLYTWCKNEHECFNSTSSKYRINAITTAGSGSYTCAAHNKLGSALSDPLEVDVKYAPKNVKIWSNNTTFMKGERIAMECSVESSNPPVHSYMWYRNGNDMYRSTNTITVSDAGKYYCKAGNAVSYTQSKDVEISMLYAPKKPLIKAAEPIVEGRTVTLTCATSANPPVSLYTWCKNERQCFNSTSSIYQINAITTHNNGSYTCAARNNLGSALSDPLEVDVKYPPKGVKIILEPDSKIFREGTKVKFACFVSSSNPRVTSIAWLKDNKKVSTFMEEISISAEDSGMYTCQAGNNIGQSFSQPVSVEVHYPPKAAKIKIVKGSETKQGDQVTLKCSADSGNPKLIHYEWLKDGELYKSTGVSDSLLINLTWKDSGYYSCAASNSVGKSTSKSAILNVQYAPQNVTLSITPGNHVTEYTDVMLRCQAQSNPQCQYSLYKDNQLLKVNEYLALGNIQRSDTGEYRCSARNTVGVQKSEVVHLYVAYSWYTIGIYISSVLGSLTLFIIFVILIVHFRVWKKNCKKTADDSSFFVLKKQSHNESHTGQDTPSANSSTDCLNYSTLQFPAGGNGQIKQPRLERNREDPSAIYSTVKKSHTAAEYENIESSKKVHDGAQDEIHYSVIANLPKEGSQRKQDPEVEYAMLRH